MGYTDFVSKLKNQQTLISQLVLENDVLLKNLFDAHSSATDLSNQNLSLEAEISSLKLQTEFTLRVATELHDEISSISLEIEHLRNVRRDNSPRDLLEFSAVAAVLRELVEQKIEETSTDPRIFRHQIKSRKSELRQLSKEIKHLKSLTHPFDANDGKQKVECERLQEQMRKTKAKCLELKLKMLKGSASARKWRNLAEDLQVEKDKILECQGTEGISSLCSSSLHIPVSMIRGQNA